MNVLGVSCFYHDAAACLAQDGRVLAAAMEERFSRKKHDISFPDEAVQFCLRHAGIDADRLDSVVFYENPYLKFQRILWRHLQAWPNSETAFVRTVGPWLTQKLPIRQTIKRSLRLFAVECPVDTIGHHLSHSASAFYCSPFPEAAIITLDGIGEWATSTCTVSVEATTFKLPEKSGFHILSAFSTACSRLISASESTTPNTR